MRYGFRSVADMEKRVCPMCDEDSPCEEECRDAHRDWWHCLLCRMPQAVFDPRGGASPVRCDFCGWDEATECVSTCNTEEE
jgi:hypothetical protein